MRAGPKGLITAPPLNLRRLPRRGGARAIAFIERYVTVPKGTGARHRMKLRPWQREIIRGVLDDPRPRQALVAIPAGNGKSTLAAAIGLYGLLDDGVEGAQVLVVASDERQARSPTLGTRGWPATSGTRSCVRMPAVPGSPRNAKTRPGGSTPRWPPSWPMTGPPP